MRSRMRHLYVGSASPDGPGSPRRGDRLHCLPMVKPRVDKLLDHADSNYAAVVVSAKRARQINSYFHNLGEGGFGEYPPPMVETNAEGNYLTMALEELAEGKLKYEYRS